MRAEIIAYMIYSEGPEYPEYVMHFYLNKVFRDPQISEYVRQILSQSVLLRKQKNCLKYLGHIKTGICYAIVFLHKVFPGMLQAIISNSKMTQNAWKSHFSVIFESLFRRPLKVTFESLVRHFNCFWFSGVPGGHAR